MSNELPPLSGPVDASGEPDFWRCKTCGCLWQDNHDGTVSLGSTRQSCCETCDREPSHIACEPLFRAAAADIRREMHAYLDTLTIHGDNIGAIRGSLLMPFDSQWNGWVRDDTAAREVSAPALKSAAAAVPSSPAQADLVRALHTVAMTIADALSGKAVDFREALRLIHDMQLEARDGSLTLSALPPSSPVADPSGILASQRATFDSENAAAEARIAASSPAQKEKS